MHIFIMNGRGASGKTTFEKMIQGLAENNGEKIAILSTIDYVKDIAKSFGWNGSKTEKDRKMLSDLKDLLTEWNDIPHQVICQKIKELQEDSSVKAIFIDSREPSDIKRFVDEYNALTVIIKRSNIQMIYGNHADDNVEDYKYDCVIDNSRGLVELYSEAQVFYETFIKGDEV